MSSLQRDLLAQLIALGATISAAMDAEPGFMPCGTPTQVIVDALGVYAQETPAEDDLAAQIKITHNLCEHVGDHRGVEVHQSAQNLELSDAQQQLVRELIELAAQGVEPASAERLYRGLASLETA